MKKSEGWRPCSVKNVLNLKMWQIFQIIFSLLFGKAVYLVFQNIHFFLNKAWTFWCYKRVYPFSLISMIFFL